MSEERENLDWATYGVAVRQLAQQVADDGFQPDLILAIARGGLFVAGSLGYALAVKNLYVMNVEYYTGIDERLDVPVMLPPHIDLIDHTQSNILIADD
ncbi:MAG: phosphoribosyltransferase, partial [Acidimicrobiales bacterium]